MAKKLPVIAIIGPTGIGKTALAVAMAQFVADQLGLICDVVSADSRQIYQQMDIGTAKPEAAELAAVHHHLIDLVPPDEVISLADFQARAYAAIEAIHHKGGLPLLVGGTGQWVKAVVEGWGVPKVPPDFALRAHLEQEAVVKGAETLHAKLAEVDPEAAAKIDYRNIRRVVRALEVYHKTNIPISVHQRKTPPPYRLLQIGLSMPREDLYARIDARIDRMMAHGLLAEVERLLEQGYSWDLPAMSGLGYRQFKPFFEDRVDLAEVVSHIKRDTRRFIRQQYNWFSLDDESITWIDVSKPFEALVAEKVLSFLHPSWKRNSC